ncbi:nectin-2-like isoform X2 [Etheostoma cragini]|uniref:nectin-2-like isoform X2 n=1 Tax=Etheostoma cragini TaxID=417921 RepID=UPI00155E911D|nr:nectin-2-like isoform X2 [Etheostoma cragini]
MKTCRKLPVILLKLIYITLHPVLEAQEVKVLPEVTGYVGRDVTLPCQFVQAPQGTNITQLQWTLQPPEGKEIIIIVVHFPSQHNVHESFKDRVGIAEQSLIIRGVEMRDAGSYTCSITSFPSGSLKGTTNLVVKEQMILSSAVVSAIVISILLLLAITAAIVYLIFIRRHCIYIDTCGPVVDVDRTSGILRDEDVVYSDVKLKPSKDATPPSNEKHTVDEDVTYSEIVVGRIHQMR